MYKHCIYTLSAFVLLSSSSAMGNDNITHTFTPSVRIQPPTHNAFNLTVADPEIETVYDDKLKTFQPLTTILQTELVDASRPSSAYQITLLSSDHFCGPLDAPEPWEGVEVSINDKVISVNKASESLSVSHKSVSHTGLRVDFPVLTRQDVTLYCHGSLTFQAEESNI